MILQRGAIQRGGGVMVLSCCLSPCTKIVFNDVLLNEIRMDCLTMFCPITSCCHLQSNPVEMIST